MTSLIVSADSKRFHEYFEIVQNETGITSYELTIMRSQVRC